MTVERDNLVASLRSASLSRRAQQLAKIGRPVDRNHWGMTPPPMNEIAFPAGILQPPMFDMDADDAANYGAIGVVIGHEVRCQRQPEKLVDGGGPEEIRRARAVRD